MGLSRRRTARSTGSATCTEGAHAGQKERPSHWAIHETGSPGQPYRSKAALSTRRAGSLLLTNVGCTQYAKAIGHTEKRHAMPPESATAPELHARVGSNRRTEAKAMTALERIVVVLDAREAVKHRADLTPYERMDRFILLSDELRTLEQALFNGPSEAHAGR